VICLCSLILYIVFIILCISLLYFSAKLSVFFESTKCFGKNNNIFDKNFKIFNFYKVLSALSTKTHNENKLGIMSMNTRMLFLSYSGAFVKSK